MAKIFWDTNLFIYLFEGEGPRTESVARLWDGMKTRGDHLYTSALTVGEVLVKPSREGARMVEQNYLEFFNNPVITVIPFDLKAAGHFGRIRTDTSIRPADAIQLACAAAMQVDLFLTNDDRLSRKYVSGIQFIASLDRAPL